MIEGRTERTCRQVDPCRPLTKGERCDDTVHLRSSRNYSPRIDAGHGPQVRVDDQGPEDGQGGPGPHDPKRRSEAHLRGSGQARHADRGQVEEREPLGPAATSARPTPIVTAPRNAFASVRRGFGYRMGTGARSFVVICLPRREKERDAAGAPKVRAP